MGTIRRLELVSYMRWWSEHVKGKVEIPEDATEEGVTDFHHPSLMHFMESQFQAMMGNIGTFAVITGADKFHKFKLRVSDPKALLYITDMLWKEPEKFIVDYDEDWDDYELPMYLWIESGRFDTMRLADLATDPDARDRFEERFIETSPVQ